MSMHSTVHEIFDTFVRNLPVYLLHLCGPRITLKSRDEVKDTCALDIAKLEKEYEGRECVEAEVMERLKKTFRYAILSHRWNSVEPTFQDLIRSGESATSIREGAVFEKLQMFCEKARTDYGCQWAWIDTCCINKKGSHIEFEDPILSMFSWYQNAAVCMIYMGDIGTRNWQDSVWFSRGWTLQELLASRCIKIFVQNWEPLTAGTSNDKEDDHVVQMLSNVTRIPIRDIRRFQPGLDRVREKMVWASRRWTTRVEDMAYCLIGIFDITLPILYGEGNYAFYRLQAEIMRKCNDRDLLLWEGQPYKHNSIFASSPRCFTPIETSSIVSSSIASRLITRTSDVTNDLIHEPCPTFLNNAGSNFILISLSENSSGKSLPIMVICGDMVTDLAAVMGIACAFISDMDDSFDIKSDEDIMKHVHTHIQQSIDDAVFETTRQIDLALQKLNKDLRCNYEFPSRVRQYLCDYFGTIHLPPRVYKAFRERPTKNTSTQTSFILGQTGLTLPIFDITSVHEIAKTGNARVYRLEVETLKPVTITTDRELLSHRNLTIALLNCKVYSGFNILNDLLPEAPKVPHHHQALLLARIGVKKYTKVVTKDIIHVQRDTGGSDHPTYFQTVAVK